MLDAANLSFLLEERPEDQTLGDPTQIIPPLDVTEQVPEREITSHHG